MATALFISPHLDDVAFSCGGTLMRLIEANWDVYLCTIFTESVQRPTGFALRCQTDKGLAAEVDYMQLRRLEDYRFAEIAGVKNVVHLDYREAPHRGYESAAELFGGIHENDDVCRALTIELELCAARLTPNIVFAPQGLGNHVDHLQVINAVLETGLSACTCWYRDTPYAIRELTARPSPCLPSELLREQAIVISDVLNKKLAGSCAYSTQIGFQFGGAVQLRETMTSFHQAEAARAGVEGFAERLLVPPSVDAVDKWFAVLDM